MKPTASLLLVTLLAGCATSVPLSYQARPSLIDPGRYDMSRYQTDYADCARLANETDAQQTAAANAVAGAVVGTVVGALLGGVIGAAFGDAGSGARYGAAWGGVSTATNSAAAGYTGARIDQETALRNCLVGRGYSVIR